MTMQESSSSKILRYALKLIWDIDGFSFHIATLYIYKQWSANVYCYMHYVCMLYIVYVREISIGVAKLGSLVRYTSLLTALIETLL